MKQCNIFTHLPWKLFTGLKTQINISELQTTGKNTNCEGIFKLYFFNRELLDNKFIQRIQHFY